MNEIERALRELGDRTRADIPRAPLPATALGRIKTRRVATVAVAAVSILIAGAGVVFASFSLRDDGRLPPAHVSPSPGKIGMACGYPLSFHASFIPRGLGTRPHPGSGSGAEIKDVIAHFSGERSGSFIDVGVGDDGYAQASVARIGLQLGTTATVGAIEDGYSVEFAYRGCDYYLNAYGLEEATVRHFAENLVPRNGSPESQLVALWPDHTVASARSNCAQQVWRRDPGSVALEFASRVMDWPDAASFTLDEGHREWSGELRESSSDDGPTPTGRALRIWASEASPGCWWVISVSRLPDDKPDGTGVKVVGRDFRMNFLSQGAASATVEVGYGNKTTSLIWRRGDGEVHLELPFEPDREGYALIILRDDSGKPFGATSATFPEGDFAAG